MPKPKNSRRKTLDTGHINRALFIGRFQPFHNGHLHVVKKLLKNYDELIIAIGSAEAEPSRENPFTAGERIEMIKSCFSKNELARIAIIPIRDINDHSKWVSHVKQYVPTFHCVYSNNELVRKLFYESGMDVHALWFFRKELHTGRIIREKILDGKHWENSVPKSVAKLMKKYQVEGRLKKSY